MSTGMSISILAGLFALVYLIGMVLLIKESRASLTPPPRPKVNPVKPKPAGGEKSFSEVVRPVMEWLAKNRHPHTTIIIDSTHAEMVEGVECAQAEDKDAGDEKPDYDSLLQNHSQDITRMLYGLGLCEKCGQHADYYRDGKALRPHKTRDGLLCRHRKAVKPAGLLSKNIFGIPVVEVDIPEMKGNVILACDWSRWAAIKNLGPEKDGDNEVR